jgi:hypothetical protein
VIGFRFLEGEMANMSREDLAALARAGAAHRLAQLEAEMSAITQAFPGIRSAVTRRGQTAGARAARTPARKRRRLSPEGRKRISEMMKKRWADRRKAAARAAK